MGRFSPTVLPQYYPGAAEGLAGALAQIAGAVAQRRHDDRTAASADALQRMSLIAQGFHPGEVPTERRAFDQNGNPLSDEQVAQFAHRVGIGSDPATSAAAGSAAINQMAPGVARPGGAAPVTRGDERAIAPPAGVPDGMPNGAPTGKPMGAFDISQVRFDYTPKSGAVGMGKVLLSKARGAQPESWYYDPETSPAGLQREQAAMLAQFKALQDMAMERDRQAHENARTEYTTTHADARTNAEIEAGLQRASMTQEGANVRSRYHEGQENYRQGQRTAIAATEAQGRLDQNELAAISREAAALASKPGPYYGKIDKASDAVYQAHLTLKQRLAQQQEEAAVADSFGPPSPQNMSRGGYTPQRQSADRRYQTLVSAIKARLAAATTPQEQAEARRDLDQAYRQWGAAVQQ